MSWPDDKQPRFVIAAHSAGYIVMDRAYAHQVVVDVDMRRRNSDALRDAQALARAFNAKDSDDE